MNSGFPIWRLREIERLIVYRDGVVPPTEDCNLYLEPIARCFRRNLADKGKPAQVENVVERFEAWQCRFGPELTRQHFEAAAVAALRHPRLETANMLGRRLCLTDQERTLLKITTFRGPDLTAGQHARRRRERKRERDRLRAARKRAERGAIPRSEYLAGSKARTRPWEAMGISRATYYRKLKGAPPTETGLSPQQAEIETRPSARENAETGKSSSHLYRGPGSTRLTLRHDKGSGRSREEGASGGRASAPPDSAVASDTITTKTRLAFQPVSGPWGMRP